MMSSAKAWIFSLAAVLFIVLGMFALTPVPAPTAENTHVITGLVEEVSSPCCKDVALNLRNDEHFYYINRGLERGLDVVDLARKLKGQTVHLHVIQQRWTPLDPFNNSRPVAQVVLDDEVVFTALEHTSEVLP